MTAGPAAFVAMTAVPAAGPWMPQPFPGMRVEHFDSKRRGTVVRLCAVDRDFMWIDFDEEDDPRKAIQRRRVNAFQCETFPTCYTGG
jgi:hypothetical protein